jgi:hypothetical protein
LLANHHSNHEDLFLAIFKKKTKTKKMLQKHTSQNAPTKTRSKEIARRKRLAGHMPRRLLATYQMMSY